MGAGEIAYVLTGDEANLLKALRNSSLGASDLEGHIKNITKESVNAAREQQEFGRLAKKIHEDALTPAQKYAEQIGKFKKLYDDNKISLGEYEHAAKQAHDQMVEAGKAGEEAFGDKAAGQIRNYVTGIVSVGAAIGLVKAGFTELDKIRQEAADRAKESEFSFAGLAEISHGNQKEFQANLAGARRIAKLGGLPENEASLLQSALARGGAVNETDTFIAGAKSGVFPHPAAMAQAAVSANKLFGDKDTLRGTINAALGSGAGTPGRAEELLKALVEAGPSAKLAGFNESTAMSSISATSQSMGGVGSAAGGLKAFARVLSRLQTGEEAKGELYTPEQYEAEQAKLKADEEAADQAHREKDLAIKQDRIAEGGHRRNKKQLMADKQREADEDFARSEDWHQQQKAFADRRSELEKKKKTVGSEMMTDEEGQVIDSDTQKIRHQISQALTAVKDQGPMAEAQAIGALNLSPAALQKAFPRGGAVFLQQLLANAPGYAASQTAISAAQTGDLFGKTIALPATDASVAAAGGLRVQEAGLAEADRPWGTETNLYKSVVTHQHKKLEEGGETFARVVDTINRAILDWGSGARQNAIGTALYSGALNDDPDLMRQAAHYMHDSAKELQAAAEALKQAHQPSGTLGHPDVDK